MRKGKELVGPGWLIDHPIFFGFLIIGYILLALRRAAVTWGSFSPIQPEHHLLEQQERKEENKN